MDYYACPYGDMEIPEEFNIEVANISIIDDRIIKDTQNVYFISDNFQLSRCKFYLVKDADPDSFILLNDYFQLEVLM